MLQRAALLAAFLLTILPCSRAQAHPLSQGSLDIAISPDKVLVHARVTFEEVAVTNMSVGADPLPGPWAASGQLAFDQHADYLAGHLHLKADGKALTPRVVKVVPASGGSNNDMASYDIVYALPSAAPPKSLELSQNVLTDAHFAPGVKWEATYIIRIAEGDGKSDAGLLLTADRPVIYKCKASGSTENQASTAHLFKDYFIHGVKHILNGWDHLLFISALVLATRKLMDLVKVVTAFTIAHTITLTLAALKLVHLPEQIVEPLISLSIVFVAVQNVFWPKQSRGWGRLGAAFFFGLFHGLGFAGGLLEAMQGMPGTTLLVAIAAFSLGVETGHQMIVLPLFGALKIARHTREHEADRDKVSLLAQRLGSAVISLAGLFYLVLALRLSFVAGV